MSLTYSRSDHRLIKIFEFINQYQNIYINNEPHFNVLKIFILLSKLSHSKKSLNVLYSIPSYKESIFGFVEFKNMLEKFQENFDFDAKYFSLNQKIILTMNNNTHTILFKPFKSNLMGLYFDVCVLNMFSIKTYETQMAKFNNIMSKKTPFLLIEIANANNIQTKKYLDGFGFVDISLIKLDCDLKQIQ